MQAQSLRNWLLGSVSETRTPYMAQKRMTSGVKREHVKRDVSESLPHGHEHKRMVHPSSRINYF